MISGDEHLNYGKGYNDTADTVEDVMDCHEPRTRHDE